MARLSVSVRWLSRRHDRTDAVRESLERRRDAELGFRFGMLPTLGKSAHVAAGFRLGDGLFMTSVSLRLGRALTEVIAEQEGLHVCRQ